MAASWVKQTVLLTMWPTLEGSGRKISVRSFVVVLRKHRVLMQSLVWRQAIKIITRCSSCYSWEAHHALWGEINAGPKLKKLCQGECFYTVPILSSFKLGLKIIKIIIYLFIYFCVFFILKSNGLALLLALRSLQPIHMAVFWCFFMFLIFHNYSRFSYTDANEK